MEKHTNKYGLIY